MSSQKQPPRSACSSASPTVLELKQSKTAVFNLLAPAHSRRSHKHAIEKVLAGIVLSLEWALTAPSSSC
jgi:hypothetical protein